MSVLDMSGLRLGTILEQATSDPVGKYAAKEWHRLLRPFTPQRTKSLVNNVTIAPWEVQYNQPYALAVYNGGRGGNMTFRKDLATFASKEWDKAGIAAGQGEKLTTATATFIKKTIGG